MKNEKLKILIDTNVAITYISGREDKYANECVAIINDCANGKCDGFIAQHSLVITSNHYEYVYQILQKIDYTALNRGSTQPLITQSDMKKVLILLPSKNTLEEFERFVGILMLQHENNIIENRNLVGLRDTLLPRLMSGEIDVSNIEI